MKYLPQSELAKLFRVAHRDNTRDHLVMLTMLFTGARISQVLDIRGQDVYQLGGRWVIRIRPLKGGKSAVRALHTDADPAFDMAPLIELAKTRGVSRIFGGLTPGYFNTKLKEHAEAAGIPEDYAHSHMFRHSAAMIIQAATQRIGAVSEFLAHKSPASAFIYLQENDGIHAQTAMDNLQLAGA